MTLACEPQQLVLVRPLTEGGRNKEGYVLGRLDANVIGSVLGVIGVALACMRTI